MKYVLEALPQVLLFLVATIGVLPAIHQARMLLLGTAALFTAGAYASAAVVSVGFPPHGFDLLLGAVAGVLAALALGLACRRLRGDYFALGTLAFAELFRLLLRIEPPFPGPEGIPGISRGTFAGIPLGGQLGLILVIGLVLLVASFATALVISSPWGAALQAARDDETAARTTGLPVNRLRLGALLYGGAWAGLAGAFSVRHLSLADSDTFALTESIMVLVVILLAGRPSVARCLFFGFLVGALAEMLRFLATGAVKQMLFGVLLFLLAIVLRDELGGGEMQEASE